MKQPDHRDSVATVNDLLRLHNIPGIENVDTRAITKNVRELGTVLCVFGPLDKEELLKARLSELTSPELDDLVDLVSIDQSIILNEGSTDDFGRRKPRLAALDCGIKYNILRSLCQYFEVIWCPPDINFSTLINDYQIDVDFKTAYGKEFKFLNSVKPSSVMLAEGSEITVERKSKIIIR